MRNKTFNMVFSKKSFVWIGAALFCAGAALGDVSLNGTWRLDYFPQPDDGAIRSLPLSDELGAKSVPAEVPGNCELDLVRAGILPAPEIGLNVLKLRPYEGYQWLYTRTFAAPPIETGGRALLRFGGVDTLADYFLNGEKIGESANMFVEQEFDVTKKLRPGENTVQVLLRSVMCESQFQTLGELGYSMSGGADGEPFRKAGHMGGWDIFPRAFVSGLWRDVRLTVKKPVRIDQTAYIVCACEKERADLLVHCRVQAPFRTIGAADLRVTLSRPGRTDTVSSMRLNGYQNALSLVVEKPDLWWPRGMGEPALYDAKIEVVADSGETLAVRSEKIGIRTIRLEREDERDAAHPGQFLFRVNGEPCYVRGSNWVPLDAFHGRDRAFLRSTLEMFEDLNCNMVRVWGGGVYEPDEFFDWCDAHGVMVWQDFMTGCSVFPQTDAYAKATEEEVRAIVLKFRNRASLALWSGNNENDCAFRWHVGNAQRDPNRDRNSRVTIPNVLFDMDVTRDYLPSSPYYSPEVFAGKAQPSEEHLWGARGYYKTPFYTNATCRFASEMGYHGCPNRATLERMMTKDCVHPWTKVTGTDPWHDYHWNDEWLLKASDCLLSRSFGRQRNGLMVNQIQLVFGEVPEDLDGFIACSQFVQAEAMKTFVERFRTEKFTKKNGLIWWNVRDGWPQISDAVVDYYGGKKRAYHAIRAVQHDQLVAVRDDHDVVAVNDTLKGVKGRVKITDAASGETVFEKSYDVPANAAVKIGEVPFAGQGLLIIDYEQGGERHTNWFLHGEIPFKRSDVRGWFSKLPAALLPRQ